MTVTTKKHIEHMIWDDWALHIMDQIDVLDYKIEKFYEKYDLVTAMKKSVDLEEQKQKIVERFYEKYYIDEDIDENNNFLESLSDESYLGGKLLTVQELLSEAARRSAKNGQYSPESIARAEESGCLYISKKESENPNKQHIELILNNEKDMLLLIEMEEAIQKERLNRKNVAEYGDPLYQKDYFKEYLTLLDKVNQKYYIDEDIDHWGTIATAFYKFSTVDKFQKDVTKEQKKRATRKRQPKALVEKAKLLGLL
ncbi:hypothetical protein U8V72_17560 [Priestia filamentosa]|uniref:hypothetical protein n=1 Tax=Priestia filamentosa TaxID=1402861 RepID=UPI0005890A04